MDVSWIIRSFKSINIFFSKWVSLSVLLHYFLHCAISTTSYNYLFLYYIFCGKQFLGSQVILLFLWVPHFCAVTLLLLRNPWHHVCSWLYFKSSFSQEGNVQVAGMAHRDWETIFLLSSASKPKTALMGQWINL